MHQHSSRTQIMMHPQSRRVLKRHIGKRKKKTPTHTPPTTTTSSSSEEEPSSLPDDLIIFHILPKLPVRCLFRFNCVSKLWYTTIHHPNFPASQLTHAKSNPSLVAMLSQEATLCFFQLKEGCEHHQQPNSNNNNNNNIASLELESGAYQIVGTCNGLTCNVISSGLQICNPSTHELLNFPLPKPTTQTEKEALMLNGFGFDPVMNEYKVIHIWLDYAKYYDCRIYTLGTNKWRNVTATWNYQPSCHPLGSAPICINGTLFWKTNLRGIILSFNLHHETFHLITAPKAPQGSILHTLFDRQGCLCLVYRYDVDLKDEVQLTLFTLKDHHLLQLMHTKQQQQQQQQQLQATSSSGGARWIRSGYIRLPLKPDIALIRVAEFAKDLYVNWVTIDGHFILWDVNRNKGILNKLLDMKTSEWALLVNHAESLLSLKTFVPPSAGEVEVSYLSSREARHESCPYRQPGEIKKKKRRRRHVYGSLGYLTIPYWLSNII